VNHPYARSHKKTGKNNGSMKNIQTYVREKPGRESASVKDSKVKQSPALVNDIEKKPDDALMFQLHEMKKINEGLADLLDQRTSELAEFVAATTRSISVIGHDLRGPVCTVLAALELVKLKLESHYPVGSEQYINAATDSAKSTLNLLDKLLEWSVSKNNCATFNPVKIDLYEFFNDELGKVRSSAILKSITVDFSVATGLNISGDIQMVKSIFRNLFSNAIKFTGHGGKIKVRARAAGRFVEISVTDNGIGMSSELQESILKDDEGIFKIPGSDGQVHGIGLLLCREFIENHGSTLQIESSPGQGSKFIFSLERID
jgi:two-component system, sensor histidine kinase and response regulator